MALQYIDKQIIEHFKQQEVIRRSDLLDFYRSYLPDMTDSAFAWRIYDLKRKHIIEQVRTGMYKLHTNQPYRPVLDKDISTIGKILSTSFDHYSYNIWTTKWLNEFSELQAVHTMTIIEVDKTSAEMVFYALKDNRYRNVYYKPDETMIEKYISEIENVIIVKPMISRAPTITIQKVIVPTLEKIMVDLYCDETLFYAYQGHQLVKIFEVAIEKYAINFSKMFNYARRRTREESLKAFLLENLYDKIKDLIE